MPTLNIDVNARTERAKKDLRSLDKEVLKLSDSEKILSKSLAKSGDVGAQAFRQISSAAVKQAKAVNSAAGQFRQLRSQLQAAGAAPQAIGRLTKEFVTFRKVMEGGTVSSIKFQRTQDKFSNTLRTTARQFRLLTGEVRDSTKATAKLSARNKANQASLDKQAHALSNAKIQYKQLLAQMRRLGASKSAIRSTTQAFAVFSKGMKTAALSSRDLQRSQDRLKTSFAGTRRQLVKSAVATNRAGKAAVKGGKSITGLGTSLENLGSTAVLVAGPLSGIGSRLIAFGAIAKRGSLLVAGLFTGLAALSVFTFKSIKAFDELNLSLSKTEAILKATGKEAQITAEFVEEAASRIARRTLANLEDTRPASAILLASKGINDRNLEEMLGLAQDVAASGLMELPIIAKLIARVLEDPIANLDAFRRALVRLTPLQKDQVIHLQNIGRGAEAAAISINELKEKFGGVGESQNEGLAGSLDGLGQSWTELLEDFGGGPVYDLAVKGINKLTDALDALIKSRTKFIESKANFREGIGNLTSALGDRAVSIWDEMQKSMDEMGKDDLHVGEDLGSMIAGNILRGIRSGAESVEKGVKDLISNFEKGSKLINSEAFGIGGPKHLVIDILTPRGKGKGKDKEDEAPDFAAPSHFEKAMTDANKNIKKSFMDLNLEGERLQRGFSLISPEILNLARKHKVLDEVVRALAGNFSGLSEQGRKIFTLSVELNKSFLELGRRKEAATIIRDTRTALVKYNDELKRQIFLYDNNYIKLSNLIVKKKELRATLESSVPELNALVSASDKFGDSLVDLAIKGEGFAEGLKSTFKSLVDDILKQFLRLAVINPLLNSIFGASSSRPELGSQGGGILGLGGAGGLLGNLMGNNSNDNSSQEAQDKVAKKVEKIGFNGADRYGEALEKTNVKMEQAGTSAAGTFSNLFSDMGKGMASAAGGALGSFLGHGFADLLGFQHGGSFKVGGSGGKDSQLVAFKASPRERVSVETPGQQKGKGGGNVTYIDARGVDPGQMDRLIQTIRDLDESIEIRAIDATADARDRNPSLFGRTL